MVAALAMRADLANRLMETDPPQAVEELRSLEDQARRTTKELRHLQFLLRPLSLEANGLVAALEDLVLHENELFQQVTLDAKPVTTAGLDLGKAQMFFQIAADAVTNARRHGKARSITVKLARPEVGVLLLEVQDDGVGFDWTEVESKPREERGLGIRMMRIRAGLLGGELVVDTQKGRGTTVRVAAPVE
jgi:signal transduction histidine kinase